MRITDILIYENDDFVVLNKPSGLLSILIVKEKTFR
jgi:23S rRNA-/tRNA-specific pseudouridylate synthase